MTSPIKVLCVDDDPDTALSTATLLQLAGFETRACHDANTALGMAEDFNPDVCVLDLGMPGMDGAHLGLHLRDWIAGKEVRLVALTGRWDSEARYLTRNCRFAEHLVKPADPEQLIAAVAGVAECV